MKGLPALLLLASCATTGPEAPPPLTGTCNADAVRALVGRAASAELGAEAVRLSGARRLRWIRPGEMVTMEYSGERLNVNLDAAGNVERFNCG
jgi:hypothetical protein